MLIDAHKFKLQVRGVKSNVKCALWRVPSIKLLLPMDRVNCSFLLIWRGLDQVYNRQSGDFQRLSGKAI
jgi:hypothetical protein